MSKTIKILTPDNVEIEYNVASIGIRAAAGAVDLLIHITVMILYWAIIWFVVVKRDLLLLEKGLLNYFSVSSLLFFLLSYFYFIICDVFLKGQSLGKKIYHIRAIRFNGQGMSFKHIMIREFFRSTVDFFGIGFIVMFYSKNYRRVGDLVASTIVVEEEVSELSYMDIPFQNQYKYMLTSVERNILQDYFARRDNLNPEEYDELELKLKYYFLQRGFEAEVGKETGQFLKDLLH